MISKGKEITERVNFYERIKHSRNIMTESDFDSQEQMVIACEVKVPENEALKRAKKLVEKGIFKKTETIEDAELIYLPLWQVRFNVKKYEGIPFLSKKIDANENIYYNALTGKLLYVEKNTVQFSDLVDKKAEKIVDLDNNAKFTRISAEELPEDTPMPRVPPARLAVKVKNQFGIEANVIQQVFLPIWVFTAVGDRTLKVCIDSVFGHEVVGAFE